ncbi:MAG: alkaline shock response membrane anchor protein AmaP [Candidatus Omnitrophica bacterium]|nr:alkaline shock response membrane anchor protein AmaP [Candidatus Omnitrophota bacterium]
MVFLISFIYVVMSILLGSLLVGLAWNPVVFLVFFSKQIIYLKNNINYLPLRLEFAFIGLLIILICVRYLESVFFRSKRERAILLESPQGKVSITLFAVEDMLKRILEGKRELLHVRPRVIPGKKIIEVLVRANLTSEVNLLEFTSSIQEELREKLQSLLGEDKEIKVRIEIRKMVFKENKKLVEEEPEVPFRNY